MFARRIAWLGDRRWLYGLTVLGAVAVVAAAGSCGDGTGGGDQDERVDRATPKFSVPARITNPLFPVPADGQVVQLGVEDGEPLRVEVTTLPRTTQVRWNDQWIEAVVSQYVAYRDGRVVEVAEDYFAQADDGAVWYLGEAVDNYEDGVVADHEGSWLAGADGPGGMIMPAKPQPGDVYRPENIPDLVFEEVIVQATDVTVDGPYGPVDGAIRTEEHLMEGTTESKVFAPGYGEFDIDAADEQVTLAVAVPTDNVPGASPAPAALSALASQAGVVFDAAADDPTAASGAVEQVAAAWRAVDHGTLPALLGDQAESAVNALTAATSGGDARQLRQAAVDVQTAALDLQLVHRDPADVDRQRIDVAARQLLIDADAGDGPGTLSDVAILEAIVDRAGHALTAGEAEQSEAAIAALRDAVERDDTAMVADHAEALLAAAVR